jgi:hypothetical protein
MKRAIFLIVVSCVLIVVSGVAVHLMRVDAATTALEKILGTCSGLSGDHAACYESEVPKMYPSLTVSQLFEIVRGIRAADPAYQFCHVLAHKIGERVVAEDPETWLSAIPLNPSDGFCSNGFIHGIIGGRFRADVLDEKTIHALLPDFRLACEAHDNWKPSDLDKAICYHGIGHLYDFITNADLERALALCEETVPAPFRRVCIEGVFMQIYQPLEPDDFELVKQMRVKPTEQTVRSFCASFKEPEYVGACLRESWPMHPGMLDGTGARAYCADQPNEELEHRCYQGAFSVIGRLVLANPDDQARACDTVPSEYRVMCYSVVADTILEEDRNATREGIAFCGRLDGAENTECLRYITEAATFNLGTQSKAYARFCDALPEEIRAMCAQQNRPRYP